MAEGVVEPHGCLAELVAEPGLRVVGVGDERGDGGGEHGGGLVVDVENGGGCEPAALGEDQVGGDLQLTSPRGAAS